MRESGRRQGAEGVISRRRILRGPKCRIAGGIRENDDIPGADQARPGRSRPGKPSGRRLWPRPVAAFAHPDTNQRTGGARRCTDWLLSLVLIRYGAAGQIEIE